LTAEEHLQLFCNVKKLLQNQIQGKFDKKLEDVSLESIDKNFSGGMKRRLSMTIACVGHPKI